MIAHSLEKASFPKCNQANKVVPVAFVWLWSSLQLVCLNFVDPEDVGMTRGCVSKACSWFSLKPSVARPHTGTIKPKDWPETSNGYAREVSAPRQILGRTARSLTCLKSDCRNDSTVPFSRWNGITKPFQ